VVVGDLDLAHIQERSRWVASHIPGARLAVMKGAAHLPGFEQPAAFATLLRSFLGDHPG
jgi:pimeloyl-ACP methyl ester carboxylesterase